LQGGASAWRVHHDLNKPQAGAMNLSAEARYMLDTNIITDLIRNPQGKAAKRVAKVGEDNICTSVIVVAELRYGCAKSGSKRLLQAVEDLLGEIDVLPFDVPADADYGGIRSELEAAVKLIGSNDLLTAAHAYATAATIVTANTDDFKRIRGLKVENWLA
jgi:tRNA(fMet)-specific endonuclease VapC